jgi:plastocyanin
MTVRARNRAIVGSLAIGLAALAVTLLPMLASPAKEEPIHEVSLVVRDMAFYLDGQPEPNPTITVRAGEQVRIRLRNEDAGIGHDFAVAAWDVGTRLLADGGSEDTIVFRAPRDRGLAPYTCTPHSAMMRGTIRVE